MDDRQVGSELAPERAQRTGFWRNELGLTVSAVVLIGILVVAVAAFGLIAATKIGEAGTEVENVTFTDGGG